MPGRSSFIKRARVELAERLQRLAVAAADLVVPGMMVGLGTGSTADAVTHELGRRVAGGLIFTAVATSDRTEALAREVGIPLSTLDEVDRLAFGWSQTAKRLASISIAGQPRTVDDGSARPWATDNGGIILDCPTGPIAD